MKKFLPWILAILITVLLIVRLFYRHTNRVKKERAWYISALHYNFSARVDSIKRPGRALIFITKGDF